MKTESGSNRFYDVDADTDVDTDTDVDAYRPFPSQTGSENNPIWN